MKKSIIAIALVGLTSGFFVSCSNASNKKTEDTETAFATNSMTDQGEQNLEISQQAQEGEKEVVQGENSGEVKLNPPHGEPGHRCDIQVGEPLNSAPGAAPAMAPMNQAAPVQASPSTPQAGQGNLNPAHGLPGHRCDIAVGAPLN